MISTAVVLAGGKGVRLRPLTLNTPKPLLPVGNTPLLDHMLGMLAMHGFERVLVAVNYLGWKILRHLLEKWSDRGVEVIAPQVNPQDTADAVRRLRDFIDGDFVVTMGDVLTNMNLREFADYHERSGAFATIALVEVSSLREFGAVLLDKEGRVVHFIEKPRFDETYIVSVAYCDPARLSALHRNLANSGFYAFRYEVLDVLEENPQLMDFGRHVFPWLLENGYEVRGWESSAYWIDVGRPATYLAANFDLLAGLAEPLRPHGRECDGVWMGENVEVAPGARLVPPVALGDGVRVGSGARLGPFAVVGHGSCVRENATVEYGVVLSGAEVGEGARVAGSIIGENARVLPRCSVEGALIRDGEAVSGDFTAEAELKVLLAR
uniref:NDP-sugar synthase n=2 Tax=Thermofilum pendens TaxID=2269 RepID=A0A7J3X8S1_THEPE